MSYIPNTPDDRRAMLADLGAASVADLFADIPEPVRAAHDPDLPPALSEIELVRHLGDLADANAASYTCFLGGGCYDHFVPAVVDAVVGRSEFYTAYTPYQPEISQGTLTAIYEFQTMIAELTGLDVANASMYDGASALAEAAVIAVRKTGRLRVAVARSVHPEYRRVLATYLAPRRVELVELPCAGGVTQAGPVGEAAAVIVQQPNFFGCLEDVDALRKAARAAGALFIVSADPVSLAVLKPPGEYGADIACGEGQPLGLPMSYGGPGLGFIAARAELVRHLPGRMVGKTVDLRGRRAFVLTLQAREQHIRREKATSNICSNHALCALAATVHLSALGPGGLAGVARLCAAKAAYARRVVAGAGGFAPAFDAPFFKEFVVKSDHPWARVQDGLAAHRLVAGPELGRFYPELAGHFLVAVTEKRTRADIDRLGAALGEVAAN